MIGKINKSKISLMIGISISYLLIGCTTPQYQLPAESNPAIIGGYTAPSRFNWLQDGDITASDRRIKVMASVAKQNANNQIVIFYGKSTLNLAKKINVIFKSLNLETFPIKNTDPQKQDLVYVYVNFAPIGDSIGFDKLTESSARIIITNNNMY